MRYYRFGDLYLKQIGGVPIRGCLSGVLLRLSLSSRESAFERFTWPRTSAKLHLKGKREDWLARHRYEDDILLGATRFCGLCIYAIVKDVYAGTVPFDHTPEHETSNAAVTTNKFLDLPVPLGNSEAIGVMNPNEKYSLQGVEALKAKPRFPPCIGSRQTVVPRLTQHFQCRRARWEQAALTNAQQMYACILDFAELIQSIVPVHIIKAAWFASRGHDPIYSIGLRVIEPLPKTSRGESTSRISFSNRLAHIDAGVQDMYAVRLPTHVADREKADIPSALEQLRELFPALFP